ncbi:PASTA domain-containing protein [Glaciihabitans arcticus]|uniref:PASTA domain-containing protein n=1 Tax=Glaciihabitans arcticus TaxID=2668039 RepID=A0A4Q9GM63_9MICO|nr:transglycosylase domain-containing protein [Glaciihabitans arcticus]TBN55418.1 PASTA domain-containing protein [Glaciihabitans arcticus]
MSAQKLQPRGVLGAIGGMVGFSALAGLLVTVMVTPALAVTGMTANNTIGIFESLPDFIAIGDQPQKNEIYTYSKVDKETGMPVKPVRIASVFNQNREEIKWEQVGDNLKHATLSGEDRRFYEHGGVDVTGVIRAAVKNAAAGGVEGGASTLTMQLVKNIYIQQALEEPTEELRKAGIKKAQEASFERKLKEMKLAIGLEKRYTKDEILLAYLNIAGFGGTTYGIQAAAQRYYNVSAADVTVAQAASLMAIVQEPGARSLDTPDHYAANQVRRDSIIKTMYTEKYITAAERDEALATPVDKTTVILTNPKNGCVAANKYARQFCDYVVKSVKDFEALGSSEVERKAKWAIGGYKVYTTLNMDLQKVAVETVQQYAPNNETRMELGASSTTIQVGTGRILTMAQNKDFDDTSAAKKNIRATALNFNTDDAYGGSRGFQVGSTYKVFTLINWLQQGLGLKEVVNANPRTVNQAEFADSCGGPWSGPWKFRNDSGETGTRTVMSATAGSVNGAFVTMALQLDQCNTKKAAESLGVHTAILKDNPKTKFVENVLETNPSSILGTNDIAPMTMAAAYAGIANNGTYCAPIAVDFFINSDGEKVAGQARDCRPGIDPEVAAATQFALAGAMNAYGANPHDGIPIIGKTGTTNESKQTYIIGATTKVSTIVWVGNIKGTYPMRSYPSGGTLRHTIGRIIMGAANNIYGGGEFPEPPARLMTGTGIPLPNFIGASSGSTKTAIEGLGLTYAAGGEMDSALPKGQVARTSPGAGTVMARGQSVKVWRSNGALVKLPDAVTGNPSFNDGRDILVNAGFTNVAETCAVITDPQLENKVVSSSPSPGAAWSKAKQVKLGVGHLVCP